MSIDATRWAWQQPVKPAQKLLLLYLANTYLTNETNELAPTVREISSGTGLDRKTVIFTLRMLVDENLIIDTGRLANNRAKVISLNTGIS